MAISGCQILPAGAAKQGRSSWSSGRIIRMLASYVAVRGSNPGADAKICCPLKNDVINMNKELPYVSPPEQYINLGYSNDPGL